MISTPKQNLKDFLKEEECLFQDNVPYENEECMSYLCSLFLTKDLSPSTKPISKHPILGIYLGWYFSDIAKDYSQTKKMYQRVLDTKNEACIPLALLGLADCAFESNDDNTLEYYARQLYSMRCGKELDIIAGWHFFNKTNYVKYLWMAAEVGDSIALNRLSCNLSSKDETRFIELCAQYNDVPAFDCYLDVKFEDSPNTEQMVIYWQMFEGWRQSYQRLQQSLQVEILKTIVQANSLYPQVPSEIFDIHIQQFM
jgi:hypothetical protein